VIPLTELPWRYFFVGFNKENFPDIFDPIWMGAGILLIILIVLYVMRTRALHRHRLYLDMWEWLFWTGLITFFLLVVGATFQFDFIVVLVIMTIGLGVLAWARFRKYPPLFEAYEHQLARQRYLARARRSSPEATIRTKPGVRRRGKKR
jgi:predicted membrane-bound dolichyl-phosphate-mannose-protein mannosyltransferase